MKATQTAPKQSNARSAVLYMAAELSAKEWQIAFGGPAAERLVTVAAWETGVVAREIAKAKAKLSLPADAGVLAIQEAGRDGFAVHRCFESLGVKSLVVDSASIEVPRRQRRAKTDRLDARRLLALLRRYDQGETAALRVLHVPTAAAEDARQLHRERDRLVSERTRLTNRLRSLLVTQGPGPKHVSARLAQRLDKLVCWDGAPLPAGLMATLRRELALLAVVEAELAAVNAAQAAAQQGPATTRQAQAAQRLGELKGVGVSTAQTLGHEFFWRRFNNRKEVGAAAGLTGTPYNSGDSESEQGISKAGNGRTRQVIVETAWRWLQWQPNSALSHWFTERYGGAGKRLRRVGIVALARKLLIALWRFATGGVIPDGAILRPAA